MFPIQMHAAGGAASRRHGGRTLAMAAAVVAMVASAVMLPATEASADTGATLEYQATEDGTAAIVMSAGSQISGALDIPATAAVNGTDLPVEYIAAQAFNAQPGLTSVTLPDGLIGIGQDAFKGSALTSITIPDSVVTIAAGAFADGSIDTVRLGAHTAIIDDGAFAGNAISTLDLPPLIQAVRSNAFAGNQIASITFPQSIAEIGDGAFFGNGLTAATFLGGIPSFFVAPAAASSDGTTPAVSGSLDENTTVYFEPGQLGDDASANFTLPTWNGYHSELLHPLAPTITNVEVSSGSAVIHWSNPTVGPALTDVSVSSFTPQTPGLTIAEPGADSVTVSGLLNGVSYTYSLQGHSTSGDSPDLAKGIIELSAPFENTDGTDVSAGGSANLSTTDNGLKVPGTEGYGRIQIGRFSDNPVHTAPGANATGKYFDIQADATFTKIVANFYDLGAGDYLKWWNSKAGQLGAWEPVVGDPTDTSHLPGYLTVTFTASSSPSIAQLTGTQFASIAAGQAGGDTGGTPGDTTGGTDGTTPATGRVAGANRYETAALIADQFLAADTSFAGNVVVANGTVAKAGFDALAANYLAGVVNAPIVLTEANEAPAATLAAIEKLYTGQAGGTLYVMGGADSVSDQTVKVLADTASAAAGHPVAVKRVAGANRYETAAAAAKTAAANTSTVFLASGQVNADALAAGAGAWAARIPVLLTTDGPALPAPTAQAIKALGVKHVIALGGTDRISQTVEAQLKADGITVTRIQGSGVDGRYATAAALADYLLATWPAAFGTAGDGVPVFVANGRTGFPDALAVGPLAGTLGGLLLTVPAGDSLPAATAGFLTGAAGHLGAVTALGQTGNVSTAALTAAQTAAK